MSTLYVAAFRMVALFGSRFLLVGLALVAFSLVGFTIWHWVRGRGRFVAASRLGAILVAVMIVAPPTVQAANVYGVVLQGCADVDVNGCYVSPWGKVNPGALLMLALLLGAGAAQQAGREAGHHAAGSSSEQSGWKVPTDEDADRYGDAWVHTWNVTQEQIDEIKNHAL